MSAIVIFADIAYIPSPPIRPRRQEPARDRRPRLGRIRRAIRNLWSAPDERYIPFVLRGYPY